VKICFIADANSVHARRWIEYFCKPGNEVHILSTTYCAKPVEGTIVHNLFASGQGSIAIDGIGVKESHILTGMKPHSPYKIFGA